VIFQESFIIKSYCQSKIY